MEDTTKDHKGENRHNITTSTAAMGTESHPDGAAYVSPYAPQPGWVYYPRTTTRPQPSTGILATNHPANSFAAHPPPRPHPSFTPTQPLPPFRSGVNQTYNTFNKGKNPITIVQLPCEDGIHPFSRGPQTDFTKAGWETEKAALGRELEEIEAEDLDDEDMELIKRCPELCSEELRQEMDEKERKKQERKKASKKRKTKKGE